MEKIKETIKLFKGVIIEYHNTFDREKYTEVCSKTLPFGFVLDRRIVDEFSSREITGLIKEVKDEYCLDGKEMNSSFHKSWAKVRDVSMEQLVIEQMIHYITTYGFQSEGCFSEDTIYIPSEELEVPELEGKIDLMVIHGFSKSELKARVISFLNMGVALKEDIVKTIIELTELFDITEDEIGSIKNKEVKSALYKEYGFFPKAPEEFLRYLIYVTTGETLLIKNKNLLDMIKDKNNDDSLLLMEQYEERYGLGELATIFYRFKPIFLAFKGDSEMNTIINQINKLAPTWHRPMKEDYLNTITGKIANGGGDLNMGDILRHLKDATIFRKIRLAYALKFRTTDAKSILYRVRNGRSYAKEFNFDSSKKIVVKSILRIVMDSIASDLHKNVGGKKIHIPKSFNYTLPSTEKMFTGNLPSGSSVAVDKDMIFGVHWNNVDGHSIDLDLSLININGKLGWDSAYRSRGRDMLFSGDMTDASGKNGSSELFYVKNMKDSVNLMSVNYYNYSESLPVPFKIMVGEEKLDKLEMNHIIDPNNVKVVSKTVMTEHQKILGIIVTGEDGCKFYFTETNLESGISSRQTASVDHARNFLYNYYVNSISLNELLVLAGAELTDKASCDIDLSPEALAKDTILNLLVKNE